MRARELLAASLFFALLGVGITRAQDSAVPKKASAEKSTAPAPLERWEIDQRACRTAYTASKLGSDLWKEGDYKGTFRLYQGTLMGLTPMLDHRPRLVAFVKDQLDIARGLEAERGAFVLREALDAIQDVTVESLMISPPKKAALWERLGGEKVVRAIVHDFLAAAIKDPKVNFARDGKFKLTEKKIATLEEQFVDVVSVVGRGPFSYTGRQLLKIHTDMKITETEYDAFAGHISAAMKKHKVPEAEIGEIMNYVRLLKSDIVGK